MKELVIILLLIPFTLNAQENWQFKADNRLHFGAGVGIAVVSLPLLYLNTNDLEGSTNAAFWISTGCGGAKELLDLLKYLKTGKGLGASESDFVYTFAGSIAGALLTKFVIMIIQKAKKKKWDKKFNIEF